MFQKAASFKVSIRNTRLLKSAVEEVIARVRQKLKKKHPLKKLDYIISNVND
ncbi:hypothetical protein [Pantoea vagans]|uniref:hypothetical protein n=1 Tax=Pantoea vagans TaxID=470934 RepID=UPI00130D71E5|nr:hypothetical protein [Pantoea vagans]